MPSPASPLSPDAQQAAALIPPDDIEARSFAIIDGEIPEPRPFTGYAWEVARRLVHTSGDISLPGDLYLPDESVCGGVQALRRGCAIFTDTRMACSGIPARRLAPLNTSVQCLLDLPGVADRARTDNITRARAAMLLAGNALSGSIVAIGNAPTALLTLLQLLGEGLPEPALIIGMPVGFVNAAESKELLVRSGRPCLVLRGRKGGSPLAAATVNALAVIAGRRPVAAT